MSIREKFGEKLSVLVVDDRQETRGGLISLLQGMECWSFIVEAESEPQGLLKTRNQNFDLIVLNFNKPKAAEFEFIQDFKRTDKEKTNPTPVLILSSDFTEEDIQTVLQFEIKHVLTKPCSPEAIVEKVEAILIKEKEEKVQQS